MRFFLLGLLVAGVAPAAQPPPLLGEPVVAALAGELSGESARHNLDVISGAHRMRASRGFRDAAHKSSRAACANTGSRRSRSCSFQLTE